jgi:hypothetical protein
MLVTIRKANGSHVVRCMGLTVIFMYTLAVGGYPQGARAGAPPPIAMAEDANQSHIGHMKKSPRVNFKMLRIAEDDWQIVAECPEMEAHYIEGLKSKEDVDEWLAG